MIKLLLRASCTERRFDLRQPFPHQLSNSPNIQRSSLEITVVLRSKFPMNPQVSNTPRMCLRQKYGTWPPISSCLPEEAVPVVPEPLTAIAPAVRARAELERHARAGGRWKNGVKPQPQRCFAEGGDAEGWRRGLAGHPRVPRREEPRGRGEDGALGSRDAGGRRGARRSPPRPPAGPPLPAGGCCGARRGAARCRGGSRPRPPGGAGGAGRSGAARPGRAVPARRGAGRSGAAAGPGRAAPSRAAGRAQKRRARPRRLGVGAGGSAGSAGRGSALSGAGTGGCPGARRMPARRRGARVLWALRALLWAALARCYNVDVGRPVVFQGPNGSFFGYSVLQHYHDSTRWVLVGAPKAESKYSTSVQSPGAVFKCRVHTNPDRRCTELDMGRGNSRGTLCGKTCKEDRDDEWMGVSLARQPKAGGSVLACAHRWKNIYYETEYILPHGFCNIIPPNLQPNGRKLLPCYEEYKKKYGEEHGSCQAGIAGFFTEELVIMGAPGSYYWTGTVKVLNLTDNTYYKLNDDAVIARRYTYLGLYFQNRQTIRLSDKDFSGFRKKVDLNSDGLSDLLVGAPMFSEIRDEGQVTVYINRGNGVLEEQLILDGDGAYNAHFGESMATLGDIDDDGFPDVAIGAPKEDNYIGAVYIYHGDTSGIVPQYSMKLSGQTINPMLRMFGQSISGGVDMDGNGYPDMTVGAFLSDNVVLLRSRPVITMDISIFLPASINITAPQCHDGLQPVNCLNVTACFRFSGKRVPGEIGLNYNLTADVAKKEKSQQPRVYFVTSGETAVQVTEKLQLSYMQEKCEHYLAYVKGETTQTPLTKSPLAHKKAKGNLLEVDICIPDVYI
ncbi:hypothetical protein QYF61_014380 [Mycteria americana]|uniref:Integrin alpha first immunoglubulin-like domain-containing protein n=1 Tax=Mycteria americana TaxID=33587 RepID=A0AAN7S3J0_MYCAM|nr:hypothetical protein QYF61_014380 [Mycteria americana]